MSEDLKKYGDLLSDDGKALAHLGTVMPDGAPQVTPVWFDYDGRVFRVNSARGRVKDRNMRRDPAVALSIVDPGNPYRYVGVRGRVVDITETGRGRAHRPSGQEVPGEGSLSLPTARARSASSTRSPRSASAAWGRSPACPSGWTARAGRGL